MGLGDAEDKEDEKRGIEAKALQAIESSLTSLVKTFGHYGAVSGALWNVLQAAYLEDKRGGTAAIEALGISPPLQVKFKDLKNALDSSKKAYKESDWKHGLYAVGEGVSFGAGIAVDRVIKKADNLATWFNDEAELWQKIARTMGYSDWDVGGGHLITPEYGKKKGLKNTLKGSGSLKGSLKGGDLKSPLNKGEMGQAHRDGTIEVDPNLSPLEREKTIRHEQEHVKQMQEDGLDYDDNYVYYKGNKHKREGGKIEFNGKMFEEGHPGLPWEGEAFAAEGGDSPLNKNGDPDWAAKYKKLRGNGVSHSQANKFLARQGAEPFGIDAGIAILEGNYQPEKIAANQQKYADIEAQAQEGVAAYNKSASENEAQRRQERFQRAQSEVQEQEASQYRAQQSNTRAKANRAVASMSQYDTPQEAPKPKKAYDPYSQAEGFKYTGYEEAATNTSYVNISSRDPGAYIQDDLDRGTGTRKTGHHFKGKDGERYFARKESGDLIVYDQYGNIVKRNKQK